MALYGVILAGGSGTRFWPLSRARRPKQFLPLVGGEPLLRGAFGHLKALTKAERILTVCGATHATPLRQCLPELPRANVLVEPCARNTAPALALAVREALRRDPSAVLVVLPADHHVAKPKPFRSALKQAIAAARKGAIVTIGITPTRPETGFGYIRLKAKPGAEADLAVESFVEKPDGELARTYVESGEYLWNAGIFVAAAQTLREAYERHLPEVGALFGARGAKASLKRTFERLPSVSIDVGIAERADNLRVVRSDCGWSDLGSFVSLADVSALDAHGNVVQGSQTIAVDSENSVLIGGSRPLAVVGVRDLIVIDAGDAVLVVPKERCQDVRQVVDALRRRKLQRYL